MDAITLTAKSTADQLGQWRIANQEPSDRIYRYPHSSEGERSDASERTVASFLRVASEMRVAQTGTIYTDDELGYE